MGINSSLPPKSEEIRQRVRDFIETVVRPGEAEAQGADRSERRSTILELRRCAREAGLWLPHMPTAWGGMGLSHLELATVQAEAARTSFGPFVLNCQAPDEGNMHTLLHWG